MLSASFAARVQQIIPSLINDPTDISFVRAIVSLLRLGFSNPEDSSVSVVILSLRVMDASAISIFTLITLCHEID